MLTPHVFHVGSGPAFARFMTEHRSEVVKIDQADDRVIVWTRPIVEQDGTLILATSSYQ